jgi:hypothetical protein
MKSIRWVNKLRCNIDISEDIDCHHEETHKVSRVPGSASEETSAVVMKKHILWALDIVT